MDIQKKQNRWKKISNLHVFLLSLAATVGSLFESLPDNFFFFWSVTLKIYQKLNYGI